TIARRMRGLLGRSSIEHGEGMLLRPAWSIHTAFMRFPIDVVFLDHDQVVVRIEQSLGPFHTASCRGAREIVELAAGECERRELQVGDRVTWAPRVELEDGVPAAGGASGPTRGSVVVASADHRFAKLARFLLDGQGIAVTDVVAPDDLRDAVDDDEPDVVVLDAGDQLGRALRLAHSVHARRPATSVVLVGEGAAARAPESARVYDKWQETDDMLAAVSHALEDTSRIQGTRA
ncbi:MAG: DUF192 domain-containing protein, partial [Thermoleophilia bacterium]|nr:DUF192 domain-containing protein [Thermoleophilia bacterium]